MVNRWLNINSENVTELESTGPSNVINSSRNASFVVNLLQKKTPTATGKVGTTKMSSYRTIEEAKIRDSNDQPDAPKVSHHKQ